MKIENSIGWCDETTNGVTGCDKVSAGCKNCYAQVGTRARVLRGQGIETWGPQGVRHPVNFEPVFRRLNKLCVCDKCHTAAPFARCGSDHMDGFDANGLRCCGEFRRIRLFADSNSDWLDPKWPIETLARFLGAIHAAPNIDVLLLTKRIELFNERLPSAKKDAAELRWGSGLVSWLTRWIECEAPANVWLGVSVENQKAADERIRGLIRIPAAVRFLSVEPLLELVDLQHSRLLACANSGTCFPQDGRRLVIDSTEGGIAVECECSRINHVHWVIVGGESGKNRRDCGIAAIESVADQCLAAGVPCYVKQDCAFKSGKQGRISEKYWAMKQFPKPNYELRVK